MAKRRCDSKTQLARPLIERTIAPWSEVADGLPAMLFASDVDGRLRHINARLGDFVGGRAHDLIGRRWTALVHADDVGDVEAAWQAAVATGAAFASECRLRRGDGSYAAARVSAATQRDETGTLIGWYGVVSDVERRVRAEEAVREHQLLLEDSERRFSALAEAIPVICWTADASGWIDWYNRRWYEYTGQAFEDALGWGWQAAHHPHDFLEVMKKWPHSIATGDPFEMEYRLRRHDGIFHWFLARVEPLRDVDERIVRWCGSNVDIDDQKRALERTRQVAETLQGLFLPSTLPQKPHLRFDAVYLPAEEDALVGGDWFDAFELPDGRLVFSIGDVAGHGLQASVIAGRLRQAIFTLAFKIDDPALLLKDVDRILTYQEPETVVTALVGLIDPTQSKLTFASAGHPPPLIAYTTAEPAQVLPYGDPPLGIGYASPFTNHHVAIASDAVVALYTDGFTEFSRDAIAGEAKLRAAIALLVGNTTVARPALATREVVLNDMRTPDDAALLVMQFSSIELPSAPPAQPELERTWRFHSSDAYAAHVTRREIMGYLRGLAADRDEFFYAELVLGEMLANTVEHAPGLVEIHIDWSAERPTLTVWDTGPGLGTADLRLPRDLLAEKGRGLFLINAFSEKAEVRLSPRDGAELRVVLPLRRGGRER